MNFRDQGIIITKKPLKEKMSIITLLTKSHGLYSGVIRESNKKRGDSLVEGNLVDFFWQARLHEHIGSARCELVKSYNSHIIMDKTKLYAFNSIVCLIKKSFHEREPHNNFFPIFQSYLDKLSTAEFNFVDYIKIEIALLAESGHKLQLDRCAVSGSRENLYYVSPKTGRAVSKNTGAPYATKLLKLPLFLANHATNITYKEKKEAFDLTSYFLDRYILNGNPVLNRSKFKEHMLDSSS